MPTKATSSIEELVISERKVILDKANLRTALFAEKFFPPVASDPRTHAVIKYEAEIFDNSKHPLYGNLQAAHIWAALQGITNAEFNRSSFKSVQFARAVCIIPVNTRNFEWDKDGDIKVGTTYICTGQDKACFHDATGKKVHIVCANTGNIVPAGADAIVEIVDALLALTPATFIKLLGDALENVPLE